MPKEKTLVLNAKQIEQKITRIAYEILEKNYNEKELILIGVSGRGIKIAERLQSVLKKISTCHVVNYDIELNKDKPLSGPINFSGELKSLKGKSVVLVDDVLNSGRTLIYAAKHLLDTEPNTLAIAVLIDRFHRRFPVRADYVGLTLSTNLKEHIQVEMAKGKESVFLE